MKFVYDLATGQDQFAVCNFIGSTINAISGAKSAGKSRRAAQQTLDLALQNQPGIATPSISSQNFLMQQLLKQALQPAATFQPQFFTPEQEEAAADTLKARFGEELERQRQQVVESGARRGLFRSGVGAKQEREFLGEQSENLLQSLLDQQLAFQQARARENALAFQLNQGAQAQRTQSLLGAGNAQRAQLGQQASLFNALLGLSGQQAGGAAVQQAAANQALGQAIGGPLTALGTFGALSAFGAFPGSGGAGGSGGFGVGGPPASQFSAAPGLFPQPQQFGFQGFP